MDVFFDVDGCLIDTQYWPTVPPAVIKAEVERTGSTYHLNSNRSVGGLVKFRERYGFNGVIIIENGAAFYDPRTGEEKTFGIQLFDRKLLASELGNVQFTNTDVLPKNLAETTFFAEQSRQFTMTVYPRVSENGFTATSDALLEETAANLADAYPEYEVGPDKKYYNVLLVPKTAKKGTMIPNIATGKSASFGDAAADISMFEKTTTCGCPANADAVVKKAVKARNGHVSLEKFTAGALDFMRCIHE